MKSCLSFLSSCLLILGLAGCGTARDSAQEGSTFCFGCHSETSELGKKIKWAEAGYDLSVHKNGQVGRIYTPVTMATGACAPWPDAPGCFVAVGTEFEGSNAFYANSGGCQMCHTQEGFRKRVAGDYDQAGLYSIKTSWDTRAQVGSPSSPLQTPPTANTPLSADVIAFPSPLGCFGCHTPHGQGTPDGVTLPQTIPVGTPITTQTGAVWGANKAKGHICAECHEIRLNNFATTADSIVANVTSTAGRYTVSAPWGTHHGPQTDMLLGEGGAEYVGTTAGGFTFAGTYNNSPHAGNRDADCISCHAQSDIEDIEVTGSFSVNASVGGHSFRNKGFVHGTEKALVIGCGSTNCHTAAGVFTSAGNRVVAANVGATCTPPAGGTCTAFSPPSEYLQKTDAYFQKLTGSAANAADSNYHLKVNELLTKLARPSTDCTGLLAAAADLAANTTGAIGWAKMEDQATIDRRCISTGSAAGKGILRTANPRNDNTNASVRFLKGLWNFKFVLAEDKSFGVHNTKYALELLYDSCADLSELTAPGSCGGHADGQCDACNGTNVLGRP